MIADVAAGGFSFLVPPSLVIRAAGGTTSKTGGNLIHEDENQKYSQLPTTAYISRSLHVSVRGSGGGFRISRDTISLGTSYTHVTHGERRNTKLQNLDNFSLHFSYAPQTEPLSTATFSCPQILVSVVTAYSSMPPSQPVTSRN